MAERQQQDQPQSDSQPETTTTTTTRGGNAEPQSPSVQDNSERSSGGQQDSTQGKSDQPAPNR